MNDFTTTSPEGTMEKVRISALFHHSQWIVFSRGETFETLAEGLTKKQAHAVMLWLAEGNDGTFNVETNRTEPTKQNPLMTVTVKTPAGELKATRRTANAYTHAAIKVAPDFSSAKVMFCSTSRAGLIKNMDRNHVPAGSLWIVDLDENGNGSLTI